MEIKALTNNLGQYTLQATRSEYDAVLPVPELSIDHQPQEMNRERVAMACYLVFGPWCGGDFVSPEKFGPNTARAMMEDFGSQDLFCSPIEFYPKPLAIGSRQLRLREEPSADKDSISVLRSDQWNGSIRSHRGLTIASNAFLFKTHPNDYRPLLAVAMLFAADLDVDVISVGPDIEEPEETRLRGLLDAVRLGLHVDRSTYNNSVEMV